MYPDDPVVHEQPAVVRAHPAVVPQTVVPAASAQQVVTSRRISPAAVLGTVLAIALGVIGAVALIRADLEGPLDEPIVVVAGFDHTALLGLIEVGAAVALLAASLSRDRGAILFVSILIGTAALIAAIEPTVGSMGIERSYAVLVTIAMAALALVAAIEPSIWRTTRRVEVI
jgi:hypothetical protein